MAKSGRSFQKNSSRNRKYYVIMKDSMEDAGEPVQEIEEFLEEK